MDGSFIPPGRAQGRGLKDQLVICTIWSRGKEYHFIFRGKKALALAHAHTCWEEAIPFPDAPLCLPIHLPRQTFYTHTASQTFTWAHRCLLSLPLSLFWFFFWFFIFAQQKQKLCLNHILGDLEDFLFFGTRHDISRNKNQLTSLTVSPE